MVPPHSLLTVDRTLPAPDFRHLALRLHLMSTRVVAPRFYFPPTFPQRYIQGWEKGVLHEAPQLPQRPQPKYEPQRSPALRLAGALPMRYLNSGRAALFSMADLRT